MEVNSIEELVAHGEQDLQKLAEVGNTVATKWLANIQAAPDAMKKLFQFGEMKIALMQDIRPDAVIVYKALFPSE